MNVITEEALAEAQSSGPSSFHKRRVSAIDGCVGARLRATRQRAGISRRSLADRLGLSVQQLSKYEVGSNRISVALLYHAADALGVAVQSLLPEMNPDATPRPAAPHDDEEAALRFVLRNIRSADARSTVLGCLAEMLPAGKERPGPAA